MSELSYVEIARLEEKRMVFGVSAIVQEAVPIAGGVMCYDGPKSWANQAMGLGMEGPVSYGDLDRLVDFYCSRGVEPQIEVCCFADESLVTGLAARGFKLREFENVLARFIKPKENLRACLPHGWPEGLEIIRVDPTDDKQIQNYLEVTMRGFIKEGEPIPETWFKSGKRGIKQPLCDSMLAVIDDQIVGGGGVETAEHCAAIFGASVVPRYRKRGIQAALIVSRLEQARKRGASLACIHSKPGIPTERNAARIGFFMAYCKAIMFMSGKGLESSP